MEEVESSLGLVRALWVSVPPGVGGSFSWVSAGSWEHLHRP